MSADVADAQKFHGDQRGRSPCFEKLSGQRQPSLAGGVRRCWTSGGKDGSEQRGSESQAECYA